MARPTKYSQELQAKADKYFLSFFKPEPPLIKKQYFEKGQLKEIFVDNPKFFEVPYIEELALELGINDDTVVDWAKKYKPFSATYKKIQILQKLRLLNKTLEKNSATGSIFQLKVNHNMIETQKNIEEHLHKFEDLSDEQLDKIIDQKIREAGTNPTS